MFQGCVIHLVSWKVAKLDAVGLDLVKLDLMELDQTGLAVVDI